LTETCHVSVFSLSSYSGIFSNRTDFHGATGILLWRYTLISHISYSLSVSTFLHNFHFIRVTRSRKSKKVRQCNGQKKKDKKRLTKHNTENHRSSNTNTTKDRGEHRCSGWVSYSCSTCDTRRVKFETKCNLAQQIMRLVFLWRDVRIVCIC